MLDDTLVIWGGEFGRTPTSEGAKGRDHHSLGFTMWLAGGGVKGGHVHGATDEFGFRAVEDRMHVHDLHATILHLMGLDHERLTYRYSGRDFRLTDVSGQVARQHHRVSGKRHRRRDRVGCRREASAREHVTSLTSRPICGSLRSHYSVSCRDLLLPPQHGAEADAVGRFGLEEALPGTSASSLEADESPDGHRRSCDASWHSWSPPWEWRIKDRKSDVRVSDNVVRLYPTTESKARTRTKKLRKPANDSVTSRWHSPPCMP